MYLSDQPNPIPVKIMNASETISGTEIGETDIACFLAPDPDSPAHNLLADYPECDNFQDVDEQLDN